MKHPRSRAASARFQPAEPAMVDQRRRRTAALVAGTFAALLACSVTSKALAGTTFPTKPVTIIVPYSAGGASDVQARLIAQKLSERWGQAVIVEDKPGASAAIGMQYVARAQPDGHTLVISDVGTLTIAPSLHKVPYDLERDFAPVSVLTYSPYLLTAHPSLPFNTLQELIDYSKGNPGKLNYGTSGLGTTPHLAGKLFEAKLGLRWTDIPAKGGAQTIQDVIAGHVDLQFNSVFSTAEYVRAGKLKALAVSSEKRLPDMPNLPTVSEVIPGYVAGGYQGMLAPAGTPPDVLAKISTDVIQVLNMPDVRARLAEMGADPVASTPQQMLRFLREDARRWKTLIKDQNLQVLE